MTEPFVSPQLIPLPEAVFDLSQRVFLRLTGNDRVRYLNGQVTQDLRHLSVTNVLPACITNAKGRLQAVVWITQTEDALIVDADPGMGETLVARLERYIVADDALLEDISGQMALLHVCGIDPGSMDVLAGFPRKQAARLGELGWDVVIPLGEKEALLARVGNLVAGREDWEKLRVERGIPVWGAELGEETLPPEAGLDKTHVDYHKGCYIGQEVISRLKSVGHVNRSLVRLRGDKTAGFPKAGDEISYLGGDGIRNSAGKVTSVARLDDGTLVVLAYVKRGVEAIEFETANGAKLRRV